MPTQCTSTLTPPLQGSVLVSSDLFGRLVARVESDHLVDRELAERIVDQALAFLGTCAVHTGEPLSPSGTVDIGWHAFLLHTREYCAFSQQTAGRFIHHEPEDAAGESEGHEALERTVAAMRAAGYAVDEELWLCQAGKCSGGPKCSQCHAGCHNSPVR